MTPEDRAEFAEILAEALHAAPRHACRFDEGEAKALHQVADHLSLSQLSTLSMLARAINGVGARVGQLMVWGMLAAIAAGLLMLARTGIISAD